MLQVHEIRLPLDADDKALLFAAAKRLHVPAAQIASVQVLRRAVDSRKKDNIRFVYHVAVSLLQGEAAILRRSLPQVSEYVPAQVQEVALRRTSTLRPVVVGFGPAGMFAALQLARAGLRPIVLERGRRVEERQRDVARFWQTRQLDTESNVQFGEGGAGTFSDGKLTTGIKNPLCAQVLAELVSHGAPPEIRYSAKPHIGTDRLPAVVAAFREEVLSLGGEMLFSAAMTGLIVRNGAVHGLCYRTQDGSSCDLETDTIVLCIGHSARDTLEMLHASGVAMQQKPFSVGVRIEHPRAFIDRAQYGSFAGHPALGAADYKLACHPAHGRGAYTFCMCPGGTVVNAASEPGGIVVNGMSAYARDGANSNSALLVGIAPQQFPDTHALSGIQLQRQMEQAAFRLGGSSFAAPAQLVGDFLADRKSTRAGAVQPSCPTGAVFGSLPQIFPQSVTQTLRPAILQMDKKLPGFALADAVLTAPETRSSSPVRIVRNELRQANIRGLFPCGEGAGYAGGIVSAAVDGLSGAHAVMLDESDSW